MSIHFHRSEEDKGEFSLLDVNLGAQLQRLISERFNPAIFIEITPQLKILQKKKTGRSKETQDLQGPAKCLFNQLTFSIVEGNSKQNSWKASSRAVTAPCRVLIRASPQEVVTLPARPSSSLRNKSDPHTVKASNYSLS